MIPEQCVQVRWNNKTKDYYINKGYHFTKQNDLFWVDIKDIQKGSNTNMTYQCDYCKSYVVKTVKIFFNLKEKSVSKKDCCSNCVGLKTAEGNLLKYGVKNVSEIPETVEKIKESHFLNNGVINASQRPDHAEKIKATSLRKYGVDNYAQSEVVINKRRSTNLKRYGHINAAQGKEIRKKINDSYKSSGNIPTSKPQLKLYEGLKAEGFTSELNFLVDKFFVDIALFEEDFKIAVEYDGWYWHQNKEKDRKRDEYLYSKGWKVLRIRSGRLSPSISDVLKKIKILLKENVKYEEIKLEDWIKLENQASNKIS